MPSGITHILLMKELQNKSITIDLKMLLASQRDFLQVGAVAPDLPYASKFDCDLFLSIESKLADKFHYESTNELILKAFERIKNGKNINSESENDSLVAFFIGFLSHIIADGVIHPFVRDKVGNYEDNKVKHTLLEMKLDVLLLHHLTENTENALELNKTQLHDELSNFYKGEYPETNSVLNLFRELILETYNINYKINKIENWIKGLHRMFSIAEGKHPKIFRKIGAIKNYLYYNYDEIKNEKDELLILKKPIDRDNNFLGLDSINYFDDCVERFYLIFIPLIEKIYNYIFLEQTSLDNNDIPAIDLDTGRELVANNNLDITPKFWS